MFTMLKKFVHATPEAESTDSAPEHSTDDLLTMLRTRIRETGGIHVPPGFLPAETVGHLQSMARDSSLTALPDDALDEKSAKKLLDYLTKEEAAAERSPF